MKKSIFVISLVLVLIILSLVCWFYFKPIDSWVCRHNEWVKVGEPIAPQPNYSCADEKIKEEISWQTLIGVINNCEVKSVMQTHSLRVFVELNDGRELYSIESNIDNIWEIVLNAKEKCGNIDMATE